MDTIIPLIVVGLVFLQVSLYARAAYVRRMIMMKRVLIFLERDDASLRLKQLVSASFEDALEFSLPLSIAKSMRMQRDEDPRMMEVIEECKRDEIEDQSSLSAKNEADRILSLMFKINLMFNRVLWIFSIVCNARIVVKKNIPVELYKSSSQEMQAFAATHQH
ncbi:TPA: hypothetical protein N3K56_003937 [Klebsiella aerogenes]|uniref:hypothetical protein n=1 Tax=Klebsiella aerogenes TaxID=548 RepID=UPI003308BE3F|nr:hypothetical protein [Klebsiella aerogenes]HDH0704661.1 hypothetical protein [Klebsiella aerogenes]